MCAFRQLVIVNRRNRRKWRQFRTLTWSVGKANNRRPRVGLFFSFRVCARFCVLRERERDALRLIPESWGHQNNRFSDPINRKLKINFKSYLTLFAKFDFPSSKTKKKRWPTKKWAHTNEKPTVFQAVCVCAFRSSVGCPQILVVAWIGNPVWRKLIESLKLAIN